MKDTKRASVAQFLTEAKKALRQPEGLLVVGRKKNLDSLAALGLTKKDQAEIIQGLQVEDYHKGPEPDRDRPGDLWFFGPALDENQLYLKLKLVTKGPVRLLKCISFHLAGRPLALPFRKEEKE